MFRRECTHTWEENHVEHFPPEEGGHPYVLQHLTFRTCTKCGKRTQTYGDKYYRWTNEASSLLSACLDQFQLTDEYQKRKFDSWYYLDFLAHISWILDGCGKVMARRYIESLLMSPRNKDGGFLATHRTVPELPSRTRHDLIKQESKERKDD